MLNIQLAIPTYSIFFHFCFISRIHSLTLFLSQLIPHCVPCKDEDDVDSSTMVRYSREDTGTLKPLDDNGTLRAPIASSSETLKPSATLRESQGIHSTSNAGTLSMDLGTMVINSDNEEGEEDDEDSTMKSEC